MANDKHFDSLSYLQRIDDPLANDDLGPASDANEALPRSRRRLGLMIAGAVADLSSF